MEAFFYKSFEKGKTITIAIYNKTYNCILNKDIIYSNKKIPNLKSLKCHKKHIPINNKSKINIYRLPSNLENIENNDIKIQNQFIIYKVFKEYNNKRKLLIIIKGKFFNDLINNINNLKIYFLYPNITLFCYIKSSNKYIHSYIYCKLKKKIKSKILIENQIIYSENNKYNFILINKETFYQNYEIKNEEFSYKTNRINKFIIIILILFLIKKLIRYNF